MLGKVGRFFAWSAYAVLLVLIFSVVGYVSFSLFVRSGVTSVPDLIGRPEADVEGLLVDHGLRPRRQYNADRYDEEIPAGHVLEQSPGSGSLMKRGAAVDVIVESHLDAFIASVDEGLAREIPELGQERSP